MSAPACILGIDGGGTRTRCAVVALDGRLLATSEAGPSNYLRVGADAAVGNIFEAAAEATRVAGAKLPVAAACACLAGVGRPGDHAAMFPRLTGLAESVRLETDAYGALAGAHALGPGVVVMAGTGAIALGKGASGEVLRVDGWGSLLGDEGSGYWIGEQALRAVCRAADGRSAPTALTSAVLGHLGLAAAPDLVNRFPWGGYGTGDVAQLAEVCSRVAGEGDAVATAILRRAGERLAGTCLALLRLLRAASPPVATTGSVFTDPVVGDAFSRAVLAEFPQVAISRPRLSPMLGAALLSLQLAGVHVTPGLLTRLGDETAPSGDTVPA